MSSALRELNQVDLKGPAPSNKSPVWVPLSKSKIISRTWAPGLAFQTEKVQVSSHVYSLSSLVNTEVQPYFFSERFLTNTFTKGPCFMGDRDSVLAWHISSPRWLPFQFPATHTYFLRCISYSKLSPGNLKSIYIYIKVKDQMRQWENITWMSTGLAHPRLAQNRFLSFFSATKICLLLTQTALQPTVNPFCSIQMPHW